MNGPFSRTEMLLGSATIQRLADARVAVFGVGGVGGYCAEALARSGVGAIDLFDDDIIAVSNINRQVIATHKSVGLYKADVMKARILDINPAAQVNAYKIFYLPETAEGIDLSVYDYVADAMDTMTAKLELVCRANAAGVPVISSMGAANKLDATAFKVADIYETSVCPVARVMRRELRKRGITALRVVYSNEPPLTPLYSVPESDSGQAARLPRRQTPTSNAFVPPVPGFIMAGEIVKSFIPQRVDGV